MFQGLNITRKDWILAGILSALAVAALVSMMGKSVAKGPLFTGGAQGNILMSGGVWGKLPGQLDYPRGIAVDAEGGVYVADSRNHRVQKFRGKDSRLDWSTGGYARVEGDVKKLTAEGVGKFNEPNGVAVGADGMVYAVDTWNNRIQVMEPKNGKVKRVITSVDGFFAPRDLVVDRDGSVYVADTGRHRVVKFSPKGERVRAMGNPKGKGTGDGEFNEPIGLALDPVGNLFVADRLNFRVQVFDANGQFLRSIAVDGWDTDQIDMEPHLAIDATRDRLYASDGRGRKILVFTLEGKRLDPVVQGGDGQALFQAPIGVAVDREGNLLVCDSKANKIMKLRVE